MLARVIRDLQKIGEIEVTGNYKMCKYNQLLVGQWVQKTDQFVYFVNISDHGLYRMEWQDIKDGKYFKTLVKPDVEHFFADKGLGLATFDR